MLHSIREFLSHRHRRLQASPALYGIALMICSMFFFSLMNVFIRDVSNTLPSPQTVFLRNLFSLMLMTGMMAWQGFAQLQTTRLRNHFWRSAIGILSMETWFYAIASMPLDYATALSFTTPIFSTIFAILFLKEQAGWRRWSAIGAGFVGMLIIIRPGMQEVTFATMMVLAYASLNAVTSVVVKTLTRTENPNAIVFYMALFMAILSFPPAWMMWKPVDASVLGLVFLIALNSTIAHICLVRAMAQTSLTTLMPFDFSRLIFTGLFAYIAFGEVLDQWTLLGGAIIVGSSVYIAHREARLERERKEFTVGEVG